MWRWRDDVGTRRRGATPVEWGWGPAQQHVRRGSGVSECEQRPPDRVALARRRWNPQRAGATPVNGVGAPLTREGMREPGGGVSRPGCAVAWSLGDSNPWPLPCHGSALPTELKPREGVLPYQSQGWRVSTSGPSSVTRMVCSNCAVRARFDVTAVHPSDHWS